MKRWETRVRDVLDVRISDVLNVGWALDEEGSDKLFGFVTSITEANSSSTDSSVI